MNQLDSMASMTSIDRAAIDGYAAYASGASMPAKYAADDMLASSWRIGRRQAEERAATEKKNPVSRMNGSQVEALAQAKRLGYRIEQVADQAAQLIYMPAVAALVVA